MAKGNNIKVRSLESIDTISQDVDVGVVRVAAARLKELGGRNALVRVSRIQNTRRVKSLTRIVRAKPTAPALSIDEIALQYDDRQALGINSAGGQHEILIERVWQWPALPWFLLSHTSPLVKKEACFAVALMIVGVLAGGLIGFLLGLTVSDQG